MNAVEHMKETIDGIEWCYSVTDGNATILKVPESASGMIDVPSVLAGHPVVGIGSEAFFCCGSLAGIKIPDGVTRIGDRVFENCGSLECVTIPDSTVRSDVSACAGRRRVRHAAVVARYVVIVL